MSTDIDLEPFGDLIDKLEHEKAMLLEALKEVAHAEKFVDLIDHNFQAAIDIAKAAIAKVEGK